MIYQKVKPKITELSVPTFRQGGFALFLGQYQVEKGKSPTQIVGLVPTAANPNVSAAAIVGDATPDYQMSFNNEVSFGPFRASALVDWKKGGDVINLTTFLYDASHNSADWNTVGHERFALQGKDTRPYVEDGSFVKLREVSLSYRVPEVVRAAHVPRSAAHGRRLSFSGRNLLMNSDYRGRRSRSQQLRQPGAQSKRRRRAIPAVALASSFPSTWASDHDGIYDTSRGARTRRAVATAVAIAAAALVVAACKDTAQPDVNNPSLEGVQDNPSRVTVTQMVRGVLEGYRLNSDFPLAFSIIGRDAYNLQSAEPRNTGELLGTSNLDPGGFGAGVLGWAVPHGAHGERAARVAAVVDVPHRRGEGNGTRDREHDQGARAVHRVGRARYGRHGDRRRRTARRRRRRSCAVIRRSMPLPSCWIRRRRRSPPAWRRAFRSPRCRPASRTSTTRRRS